MCLATGLCPNPLGELIALPQIPLLDFRGRDRERRGGERGGEERKGRKGERKGRDRIAPIKKVVTGLFRAYSLAAAVPKGFSLRDLAETSPTCTDFSGKRLSLF